MSAVALTEQFFAQAAGWQAMKEARAMLAAARVLSSDWSPPLLKGVVQSGSASYRAGLVIKSASDIENICTCRDSREWGKICAHSVAVGLHHLRGPQVPAASASSSPGPASSLPPKPAGPQLQRAPSGEAGEPAELFIILPPNFADSAMRGQVTLFVEGRWRGGRSPLNALPKTEAFAFSAQDGALLDRLVALAKGATPAMLRLDVAQFTGLLPLLVGHPRITLGKSAAITVTAQPWTVPIRATLLANGEIELASQAMQGARPSIFAGWVFRDQTLQPLGLPAGCLDLLAKPVRLPRERVPGFLNTDWPALMAGGKVTANFTLDDFALEPLAPRFRLHLAGGLARLEAQLDCSYGERRFSLGIRPATGSPDPRPQTREAKSSESDSLWLPDPQNVTRYSTRDFAAEQTALSRLVRAGFVKTNSEGLFRLEGQDPVLRFFARDFPSMQREWEVTLEERLDRSLTKNVERIEPQFQIASSGVQWFDLAVSFGSQAGEQFSAADIQRLILSGQNHTRLRNGKVALIDTDAVEELQETLLDCAPQQHGGGYRIANAQAGFLDATLRQNTSWQVQAPSAWRERARQEAGDTKLECPPLGGLEKVLRPYQKAGVAWLAFLRRNGFGGILADEMGLGKTLLVLAFLQTRGCRRETVAHSSIGDLRAAGRALTSAATEFTKPCLVVCPTSLVFNWVAEAAKFTPDLRVLALHGSERHVLFGRIPQSDLVITSYALVRRDAERYRDLEFDTVVLDEAQHIKNRQTQNAQAVKSIRSRHRLVLTGTPLENSVLDLWSIFDFLMPGYLGSAQNFRERYEIPITREHHSAAQERLARRLRPFMLRRLKREVAPELPPRIDQVVFCDLTEEQRAAYQQIMEAGRKEVLDAVGAQGLARSRMVVLTTLLRLRQICCDLRLLKLECRTLPPSLSPAGGEGDAPASGEGERAGANAENPNTTGLTGKNEANTPPLPSGKVEAFAELLEEILDGGHRALVFSQFTSMLALLRERLEAEGIDFCYLDGSTQNRGEVVARFQQGQAPVFLISLKAGGTGLNLTAADTVIHFDPWWNPAVEEQASDRAHRIGQRRVVTNYKLVTRGTVEEKILQLQERKREVIRATLGGEEQLAESLNWDEIQELLAG